MKKINLLLMSFLCTIGTIYAQINYPSATCINTTTTYTDISGTGTPIVTPNMDDTNSTAIPIGFNFSYNGATQTHFILNTNGFIKLGANASMTPPSRGGLYYDLANTYTGGVFNSADPNDVNLVVAFNHDLKDATPNSGYFYEVSGSAGSRVCTIQFNELLDSTSNPPNQFEKISFQIKLFETTNWIEVVFGEFVSSDSASAFKSAACGLKGSTITDITAVTKASTQNYSLATFLNGNYTGNAFNFGNSTGAAPRPLPAIGRTMRFIPAYNNDLALRVIHSMGNLPIPYALPHTISVPITNFGLNNQSAFKVYLEITGANPYLDTANISGLNTSQTVTASFSGINPDVLGTNNIKVFMDADDNPANDTLTMIQNVTDNAYSYSEPNVRATGGLGFNTASGLILTRFNVKGKRYVTGTDVFLWEDVLNNSFYAVVMDQFGTIVAQTNTVTGTAADTMTYKHFEFPTPPLIDNRDFYVGVAQLTSPLGFFPQGTVTESPIRAGAYFYTGLTGSATPVDVQTTALETQYLTKGYIAGNDLRVLKLNGVPEELCPDSNQSISITVQNIDSTTIDFSIDTLTATAFTTTPINQSFSVEINSGTLAPGDTVNIPITSNFNFGQPGNYVVRTRTDITLEVDSNNNKRNFAVKVLPADPEVSLLIFPFDELCYGDSVAIIAVPVSPGSLSYQWKIDSVNVGPVTSDSIFSPTELLTSNISVDLITEDCDGNTVTVSSNDTLITINPSPINVLGKDTVLENTSELYFFSPRPNSSISWTVTGGVPDNTNTNRVNIDWGSAGQGKLEITEIDNKNCEYVNEMDIAIVSIVGNEELWSKDYGIGDIFPNPTNGNTRIEIHNSFSGDVDLNLYTIDGALVSNLFSGELSGSQTIQFDAEKLELGMYIIEMIDSRGMKATSKFVVVE